MKQSIPLPVLLLVAQLASAQSTIVRNGHTITISKPSEPLVTDPFTNDYKRIEVAGEPVKLDGQPIYPAHELTTAPMLKDSGGTDIKLSMFIFLTLAPSLEQQDNGRYVPDISEVVIDSTGRLVCYSFHGIKSLVLLGGRGRYTYSNLPLMTGRIPAKTETRLNAEISKILEHFPLASSPRIGKQKVNVTGYLFSKGNYIEVKDHKATLHEDYWSL